jgi:hypothetical protein
MDDKVSEARANVVRNAKKKKGLPPTGKKEKAPPIEYKSIDEMREAALTKLRSGQKLF